MTVIRDIEFSAVGGQPGSKTRGNSRDKGTSHAGRTGKKNFGTFAPHQLDNALGIPLVGEMRKLGVIDHIDHFSAVSDQLLGHPVVNARA